MKIHRENFWNQYRQAFGKVNQKTVDAIEFLLAQFEVTRLSRSQIAYLFATIKHETAGTFLPIYERGPKSYFNKYDGRASLGNTKAGDGYRFRGRGFVQLTGRTNYERYGIADTPDSALEPVTAFHILVDGTTRGVFTGVSLDKYVNSSKTDYTNARRVINGTDKAVLIAGYARTFEKILKASAATPVENATKTPDKPQANSPDGSLPNTLQQNADTIVNAGDMAPKNEQDVTKPVTQAGPPPYNGIGFWATIKKDLTVATGGNLTFSGISEYAQQASGWPEWVVGLIGKVAIGALIATLGYFVFRVIHYLVDGWKQRELVKLKAMINTDINRKNIEFK
jgi:putative chitinase